MDRVARHLHYDQGMTISHAIASAVSQVKRWSRGGGNVKPDTRAKAAAAVASWESKKARSKARTAKRRGPGRGRSGPGRTDLSAGYTSIRTRTRTRDGASIRTPKSTCNSTWTVEPFTPHGTLDLAISSHGWVPNNPITALKWRKGAWTPPGGGSPIKAADIRARLGAKTNKDAIRIMQSDPAAMDKVTGKGVTKRSVRPTPRTATARTSSQWDSTEVRRKGTVKPLSDIRANDVVETPGGAPVVWGGTRTITRTDSDGRNPTPMVEVTAYMPRASVVGQRKSPRSVQPEQGRARKFVVSPDERLNVIGRHDAGPAGRPAPDRRLRGPRGGAQGPGRPLPADRQRAARRRGEIETTHAATGRGLAQPRQTPPQSPSPTSRQTLRPNTAPPSGRNGVDQAEVRRRAAATRQANRPTTPTTVTPDMGRQTIPRGITANQGPVESRPVRNRPRRTQGGTPGPSPTSRQTLRSTTAPPSGPGVESRPVRTRPASRPFTPSAPTPPAPAKRPTPARSATAPRRQRGGNTTGTRAQPRATPAEGALFGLTPDQKKSQKQRVTDALDGFAPGTATGAANKLLRGEPITRRVRDGDDVMEMTVQRDPFGGWGFSTKAPDPRDNVTRAGMSLPDAIAGARAEFKEIFDEDLPRATKSSRNARPAAPSGPTAAQARQQREHAAEQRRQREASPQGQAARRAAEERRAAAERAITYTDPTPDTVKERGAANSRAGVPEPDHREMAVAGHEHTAAQQAYDQGLRSRADDMVARRARLEKAVARLEKTSLEHDQRRAMPKQDPTYAKTARGGASAGRARWNRDRRPVYMVTEGEGVRLSSDKPRPGVRYALYQGGEGWALSDPQSGNITNRTTSPSIGALRPEGRGSRLHTNVSDAYADAQARPGGGFISHGPDGRWMVAGQAPDRDNPFYLEVTSDGRWRSHNDGRVRDLREAPGLPNSEIRRPRGWVSPSERERMQPTAEQREASRRDAERRSRAEAPKRAQTSYAKQEYNLTTKDFQRANTPVSGFNDVGTRAYQDVANGNPAQALSRLRQAANQIRTQEGLSGNDRSHADRLDKVAEAVEKKLRKPKNVGAALVPVGDGRQSRNGTVTRQVVDQTGREWTLVLNPDAGTVRATSGRLSGEATYKKGDQAAATSAAQSLVGEMIGTKRRREGRINSAESMSRETRASSAWGHQQAEYERLRGLDDTGQSDDDKATAMVAAQRNARSYHEVVHGAGVVPNSQSTNAKGRLTSQLMDSQGGEWSLEYDRAAGVYWVDGPNGLAGSARVNQALGLHSSDLSKLVSDLLEGKRRNVRNVSR